MRIQGMKAALNGNGRFKYKPPDGVVDHLVVGGGVVGLAVARLLALRFPDKTTYLVERNKNVGEETSSRNSEVVHAGLYYPPHSLKERLCIRGRHLLYKYCDASSIPYRKTGKLVVAHENQRDYIESLHAKASSLQWPRPMTSPSEDEWVYPPSTPAVPTELISGDRARQLEPNLASSVMAALLSYDTGIIDSHTYMESLERDIIETENGDIVYSTSVVRVDPYDRSVLSENVPTINLKDDGWVVQMVTRDPEGKSSSQPDALLARTLINSSGLSGHLILNSILPRGSRIPMYYGRGSYAAYNGPGVGQVSRLIYPCPEIGKKSGHSFQSLGTHLTLDLAGNVRFGPDIQWISPAGTHSESKVEPSPARDQEEEEAYEELFSYDEGDVDFWKEHLSPNDEQLKAMFDAVKRYLPGVQASRFRPDYVGIRPKLVPPWGGFQDFVFRRDHSSRHLRTCNNVEKFSPDANGQMITLMGIESPGLTASLAIAEEVMEMLQRKE